MTDRLYGVVDGLNHLGEVHWQFAVAMFIQVSVLVLILLVLDLLLLKRMRAAIRYGIWSLVLVKLLLPVSLSSPISLSQWLPVIEGADGQVSRQINEVRLSPVATHDTTSPQPALSVSPNYASRPRSADLAAHASVHQESKDSPSMVGSHEIMSSVPLAPVVDTPRPNLNWKAWLVLAWFTVFVGLALYAGRRAWYVWRLISEASEPPASMVPLLEDCLKQAGLEGRKMKLRVVKQLGSPAICGFVRPTILLPRNLVGRLDEKQLRFIFMHEICHWRRLDMHVNFVQTLLQIFYFYHPLVWLTNAILRRSREQAVDEAVLVLMDSAKADYGETLLNVACMQRDATAFGLQLVGVVESPRALAGRIKRILSIPLPKTARLGVTGMGAVLLSGLFLLPMAGREKPAARADVSPDRTATEPEATPTTESPQAAADAESDIVAKEEPADERPALSGQITDETGAPVTEATIEIQCRASRERREAKTDESGRYRFAKLQRAGEYEVSIRTWRWVGINHWEDQPRIHVSPGTPATRDFQLRRASRLRIRVVDEEGNPIAGVPLLAGSLSEEHWRSETRATTDRQGWATVGGLPPSDQEYIIGTFDRGYAFNKLIVKLNDPDSLPEREIVLQKGVTVKGKAVCSDGEPPVGWRINAMPSWWRFGISSSGTKVAEDGSFALEHIAPGPYDVKISVPRGEGGSSPRRVLENADLASLPQPLNVKLDHPSPASLVFITGRVEHSGGSEKHGFWIFADSAEPREHGSLYLRQGKSEFKIGPIPKGVYRLHLSDTDVEMEETQITAPAENVVLHVAAKGRPKLSGIVVDDGGKPISEFRIRVIKLRTLKGPNFVEDATWREFTDKKGEFETTVAGPGIYQLLAAAEGYAWSRSDPINTEMESGKRVTFELTQGVSLVGMVTDEEGQPVDGAQVIPLSKAAGTMPRVVGRFATTDGAVLTKNGRFELANLPGDKETLKVTHPDYCFSIVRDIDVAASRDAPVEIVLTQGGTVRGHVYDDNGRPEPNVTLYFQDDFAYGGSDREVGRFATAVTDGNGAYEVKHLPEQLCHIQRVEEWNSTGVVRHCVLPQNGQTSTVDLGGTKSLTGHLIVNGTPLAKTRLLIAGENPTFGIYKAYTTTDADGAFTFHGIAPGRRTLYYALPAQQNEWGRVRALQVISRDADLGDIDHVTGRLTVNLPSVNAEEASRLRPYLFEYDPIWTHGNRAGALARRERPDEPFVFEHIPLGAYELVCIRPGQFQCRQKIEITADNREQDLTLDIPSGTASLRGEIDGAICSPGGCQSLKLWSRDRHLFRAIIPNDEGVYEVDNAPAGDYIVCAKDIRKSPVLMEISLGEGEQRTIDFTPQTVSPDLTRRGFLMVRIVTPDGVPLPCDFVLNGPDGDLTPNSSQHARLHFTGTPGTYSLTVAYPGFKRLQRQVELVPTGADGRAQGNYDLHFYLQASSP